MAAESIAQLDKLLDAAFQEASRIYGERGFQRRIGFGKRPAIVNVDLANAWTRPGNPFSCEHMDEVLPATARLIEAARENGMEF